MVQIIQNRRSNSNRVARISEYYQNTSLRFVTLKSFRLRKATARQVKGLHRYNGLANAHAENRTSLLKTRLPVQRFNDSTVQPVPAGHNSDRAVGDSFSISGVPLSRRPNSAVISRQRS